MKAKICIILNDDEIHAVYGSEDVKVEVIKLDYIGYTQWEKVHEIKHKELPFSINPKPNNSFNDFV